jgi:tryptophanyl-tRNA synthetase
MKGVLFEYLNQHLQTARERYEALLEAPEKIEEALQDGAAKARRYSQPFMKEIRSSTGIRPLG